MAARDRTCPDCGGIDFIEDRSQGDIVCRGCGLVAEAHVVDERSEWRTFSDKDKEGQDPNRVGGPSNPLLEGGGLTTMIGQGKGKDGDGSYALNKLHMRNNNPDRALQAAFKQMGELADRLKLGGAVVKQSACELYKMASDAGAVKGRSTTAVCAACLYMACRQHNTPRSFKEITGFVPATVRKKDISAAFKDLLAFSKERGTYNDAGQTMHHPSDYMTRWCSALMLSFETRKLCQEMALKAMPKDDEAGVEHRRWHSRNPMSIAAAILFAVTTLKDPIPMHHLVTVTNVTEATIRTAFRDMQKYWGELLPASLNTPENLAQLR